MSFQDRLREQERRASFLALCRDPAYRLFDDSLTLRPAYRLFYKAIIPTTDACQQMVKIQIGHGLWYYEEACAGCGQPIHRSSWFRTPPVAAWARADGWIQLFSTHDNTQDPPQLMVRVCRRCGGTHREDTDRWNGRNWVNSLHRVHH
jgi:hypothetical protein